jgi:hypothetical protein
MSDIRPEDVGATSSIQVVVYRDGKVIDRQRCESPEEAAAAVEAWEQNDGIECVVRDLSGGAVPGDLSEPEVGEGDFDEFPVQ